MHLFTFFLFYLDVISDLYHYVNPKTGKDSSMISEEVYEIVQKNAEVQLLLHSLYNSEYQVYDSALLSLHAVLYFSRLFLSLGISWKVLGQSRSLFHGFYSNSADLLKFFSNHFF